MSILNLRPGRAERREPIVPDPTIPYAPRPKPAPPGPHQLGNTSLAALDAITETSAADIEKVADGIEQAAHEEAEGLRELARRMRASGTLAQERVATFVHVAVTCSDAARMMRERVEQRDQIEPEPAAPIEGTPATAADLDAIERQIAEAADRPARGEHAET